MYFYFGSIYKMWIFFNGKLERQKSLVAVSMDEKGGVKQSLLFWRSTDYAQHVRGESKSTRGLWVILLKLIGSSPWLDKSETKQTQSVDTLGA